MYAINRRRLSRGGYLAQIDSAAVIPEQRAIIAVSRGLPFYFERGLWIRFFCVRRCSITFCVGDDKYTAIGPATTQGESLTAAILNCALAGGFNVIDEYRSAQNGVFNQTVTSPGRGRGGILKDFFFGLRIVKRNRRAGRLFVCYVFRFDSVGRPQTVRRPFISAPDIRDPTKPRTLCGFEIQKPVVAVRDVFRYDCGEGYWRVLTVVFAVSADDRENGI